MAVIDNDTAKIEMWGDVLEEKPIDWWTGEEIDMECITPKGFKEDLDKVSGCKNLIVNLNSLGGDATVGIAIHNLLKSLNKHITVIVDGVAASAASVIMCAGDDVKVYPGSLVMIHEVKSGLCGFYSNEDLKKIESGNEAYGAAIANIYAEKTGMNIVQLRNMMKKETWMTGKEAVEKGFANTLITAEAENTEPQMQLINKNTLVVNGVKHNISGYSVPQEILSSLANQGGKKNMAKNKVEEFMNYMASFFSNKADDEQQPAEEEKDNKKNAEEEPSDEEKKEQEEKENAMKLEIANSAREEERKRLQEIDEISNSIDADLVREAKFGETACDAKELAFRAMQREVEKSNQALKDLQKDTEQSKVNDVASVPGAQDPEDGKKMNDVLVANTVKQLFNKINQLKEGK